ncbi:SNF1 kinase homolog 10, SNF1-RELATED PROTEIN KINASE 1.1 [Hibiscus trionum]|uniref:non-specific serine/threonine protein kinase n=1 Tax=Hibiscus trionum TaxID=183268 RepID=A0A9W7GXV2_HIBTR|nr:SNF1 kinase homolog 10, SNF1-RELATED PROTEIN KINASE 1.1 [Hibiscus trionum]
MDGSGGSGEDCVLLPNYKLGRRIGIGAFGKVKIAQHVLTGQMVAIKILNRREIKKKAMEEKVAREIKILKLLMHPHITRVYEVIETTTDIFMVMEYVESGELYDYMDGKRRLEEDEARLIFQQIVSGVEYCHRNMMVHRDLKLENILFDSKCNAVKIADFGFGNIMRDGHFLKTSCGSPNYAAPEVISGELYAGPEVDVWSCGVILYILLCGSFPFDDDNFPILFRKIKRGVYSTPSHLSAGARDLISGMLLVDPMRRMTIPDIRRHPWFQAHLPRYLAVPSSDTTQPARKIDEKILREVVRLGFERNHLVESLRNRVQNEGTVAYYLLSDKYNCLQVSRGYLGAEFQKTMEYDFNGLHLMEPTAGHRFSRHAAYEAMAARGPERKWALGFESGARPRVIMMEVLKALHEMSVRWKNIGHYNMKCRWPPGPDEGNVVKFEMQLYKTREEKYLLDLQRVQGPQFLFFDLCAKFLQQLRVF